MAGSKPYNIPSCELVDYYEAEYYQYKKNHLIKKHLVLTVRSKTSSLHVAVAAEMAESEVTAAAGTGAVVVLHLFKAVMVRSMNFFLASFLSNAQEVLHINQSQRQIYRSSLDQRRHDLSIRIRDLTSESLDRKWHKCTAKICRNSRGEVKSPLENRGPNTEMMERERRRLPW